MGDKEGFRDCAEGFSKGFEVGGLCEFDFELGSLDDFALQIVLEGLDELFRGLLNGDELSVSFSFRQRVKFESKFWRNEGSCRCRLGPSLYAYG